jgi:hypothetical protein
LFTSEGCSSCPPADQILSILEEKQPIEGVHVVALSEHVDYWNRLGWKDPFSSVQFSERQNDYAQALKFGDIYTPQMIVDGHAALVGSHAAEAQDAIIAAARTPKAAIAIEIKSSDMKSAALAIQVGALPSPARGDTADLMLAVTENGLASKVLRGENAGRELAHSVVTRSLVRAGTVPGSGTAVQKTVTLSPAWKRANLNAVAFVQERSSRRILGVGSIKLAEETKP